MSQFDLEPGEQTFFKELTEKLVYTGFMKMDINVVKHFYHPDKSLRFCDADGPFHHSFAEYSGWLEKIFHKLAVKQNFKLRDTYSYRAGDDVVITTALIDVRTLLANGDDIDSSMRFSLVWKESGKEWKVIHEHFSQWIGQLAGLLGYPDTGREKLEIPS